MNDVFAAVSRRQSHLGPWTCSAGRLERSACATPTKQTCPISAPTTNRFLVGERLDHLLLFDSITSFCLAHGDGSDRSGARA